MRSRREFLAGVACAAGVPWLPRGGSARLTVRPTAPASTATPGLTALGLASPRDVYLQVPAGYDAARRWPLVLALHGATQSHQWALRVLGALADARGFALLMPNSADVTWDGIRGDYGADVALLDRALSAAFARVNADPARVVLAGFSDGASYALGLGRANGDLFRRVVAFSPGFIPPSDSPDRGTPRFFISHGRQDAILPIDRTSRRLVPLLRDRGYVVRFEEFDGPHGVPPEVAALAADWMTAR